MPHANAHTAPERVNKAAIENNCYKLAYDATRNRVSLTILGFWKNSEAVPDYLHDLEKILRQVKPNFTLLADLTTMITHPQELTSMHVEAQRLIKIAGLLQVAHVAPVDRIAALQMSAVASQNQLPYHVFVSSEEAEAYLNKVSASFQQA